MKRLLWKAVPRFTSSCQNSTIHILRLALAAMAAVASFYLGSGSPRLIVSIVLSAYTAWSLAILIVCRRSVGSKLLEVSAWSDVCCYALVILLTGGSESIYLPGLLFSILAFSLRRGYGPAVSMTLLSAGLLMLADWLLLERGWTLQPERALIHCLYLLLLGHLMAYSGGIVVITKRRMGLLREVTSLSNLRFGVDRTVGCILDRLRRFYSADSCLLVTCDPTTANYSLRLTDSKDCGSASRAQPIEAALARQLLSIPKHLAVSYDSVSRSWSGSRQRCLTYDVSTGQSSFMKSEALERLAPLLDAGAMMAVPLDYSQSLTGRLYLLFQDGRCCSESDLSFLHHVIKHVMPLIANIRLMDQLVMNAAAEERRKVARDIHDSILQPFLGLRLGLAALRSTVANGDLALGSTIDRLVEMNDIGIEELRNYIGGLKAGKKRQETLVPAVRRFASRFSRATGIDVQVEARGNVCVCDRLAEEAVRIVAEGLSNVNRHTRSERATAGLECRDNHLVMRIENDATESAGPPTFMPKSINDRAQAMGGQAWVEASGRSGTAVVVKIPL